jgi:hypothetical protein
MTTTPVLQVTGLRKWFATPEGTATAHRRNGQMAVPA